MVYIVLKRVALYVTTDEDCGSIPHLVTNKIRQQSDNIINNNMLIDDIKAEILVKLDENYEKYNLCVNNVYDKLSTKCIFGQLDVSDVRDIITFAGLDTSDWQAVDFLFGSKILNKYNK